MVKFDIKRAGKTFLYICLWGYLLMAGLGNPAIAQNAKADSLRSLLENDKSDSNRVKHMYLLAAQVNQTNPEEALTLAQEAYFLAENLDYEDGESRSLGMMANTLTKIGNYPKALELNIQRLQLEEKRHNPKNYASVLMNIGVVYDLQEEYTLALDYFRKSDSVFSLYNIPEYAYNRALNLGDVYNRLNMSDSALKYFDRSFYLAKELEDVDYMGTSMTGLGHVYLKRGNLIQSRDEYIKAVQYLREAKDDEVLCETTLGLANLYRLLKMPDSAEYYAKMSLQTARQGFSSKELDAVGFLTDHYKSNRNLDSAFVYVDYLHRLNDSLNSKSRIRASQVISSNEQYRQAEMEQNRRKAEKERLQQLQMLLIAIFIPGFFLLTLFLSRIKVHIGAIRLLGILSLLFFFEYLTLLLHPTIANLTHHTPIYEILIFVVIAAFLIPAHHKLEHWLIHNLLKHHPHFKHPKKEETKEPDHPMPPAPKKH